MKIVAVSQRIDIFNGINEKRDTLDQRLIKFLEASDFIPVPVPNIMKLGNLKLFLESLAPKAIVLSGGNDLGEQPSRDVTERFLIGYAVREELPILGICRGMQMLANLAGETLIKISGHVNSRHQLSGELNHNVNSFHEYAIQKCPLEYRILAKSSDGTIKAIRHKKLPWEGWMWHPEREPKFAKEDLSRIQKLFYTSPF